MPALIRSRRISSSDGELPAAVRKLEAGTLGDPVMPVADGFIGRFVWIDGGQLGKRNGHRSFLPTDLHKHVMLAGIFNDRLENLIQLYIYRDMFPDKLTADEFQTFWANSKTRLS
jgi:hypothetical protein